MYFHAMITQGLQMFRRGLKTFKLHDKAFEVHLCEKPSLNVRNAY
jgi:hypothetical protein